MESEEKKEFVKVQPAVSVQPQAVNSKEKIPGGGKDMIFSAVICVLSVLAVYVSVWSGLGAGLGVCIVLMFAATHIYLGKPKKRTPYAVFCGIAMAVLSVGLVFSDSGLSGFTVFVTAVFLFDIYFIESADFRRYRGGTCRSAVDWFIYEFVLTFGRIDDGAYALFHKKEGEGKASRKVLSVLLGIAVSVPVLIIVIPLLISSDAAFEGLMRKIPDINIGEILASVVVGVPVAFLLFARQFAVKHETAEKKTKTEIKGVEPTVICTAMTVISAAYVLYLLSQLAYFFNAFSGLLEEGYTVAQYARRGFFEMSAVCIINLAVVFFGMFFCRKKEGKLPMGVRILSLFLCLFSLVLDATAMSKMVLYIGSFGMTALRIETSLFMIFLAVVFVAVIFRIFIKNTPYMKIAVSAAALIVAVTAFTGIDRLIANYNVDAYLDGRLSSVDTQTLRYLDPYSTVPALVRLAECDNSQLSNEAKEILNERYYSAFAKYSWDDYDNCVCTFDTEYKNLRGFKFYEYKGLELLKEKKDLFFVESYGR